jgi:hypothetical protein
MTTSTYFACTRSNGASKLAPFSCEVRNDQNPMLSKLKPITRVMTKAEP